MRGFTASFNNRAYTNLFKFSAYNLELRNTASQKEEESSEDNIRIEKQFEHFGHFYVLILLWQRGNSAKKWNAFKTREGWTCDKDSSWEWDNDVLG